MKPLKSFTLVSLMSVSFSSLAVNMAEIYEKQHGFFVKQEEILVHHDELRRESRMNSVKQDLKSNQLMQRVSRASKLIGTLVKSPNDDILGEVYDLVLDPEMGQVAYVVMTSAGKTNKGSKLFAIPWKALHWADHKYHYVLDLDKSILASSPGFNPNYWPNSYDKGDIQREGLKQFYYGNP